MKPEMPMSPLGTTHSTTVMQHTMLHLGANAGYTHSTAVDSTYIGTDAGDSTNYSNVTCLGHNSQVTGANQVQLGDSSTTTYVYGTVQNRSDKRDKADIIDSDLGLEFIRKVRPVKFKWNLREKYVRKVYDEDGKLVEIVELPNDGSKKGSRYHFGVIAQELKQVMDDMGKDFGGFQDHKVNGGKDRLSVGYDEFIAPMIKAIQEQQGMIEELQKQTKYLYTKNKELQNELHDIKKRGFDSESVQLFETASRKQYV